MSRNVQSLERGLRVLESLVEQSPRGTTELAEALELDKTIVHRLLATLQSMGYVEQDENRKYGVGMKLRQVGAQVLSNLDLRTMARPFMDELVEYTKGVAHLAKMAEDRAIYIEKIQHPSLTVNATGVGGEAPGYSSAAGKVLWAYLSLTNLSSILDKIELRPHTQNTITDLSVLHQQLAQVRQQGYAVDREEHRLGLIGVGAPVFDHMGSVVASICVAGFAGEVIDDQVAHIQTRVVDAARQLSHQLGYVNGNVR